MVSDEPDRRDDRRRGHLARRDGLHRVVLLLSEPEPEFHLGHLAAEEPEPTPELRLEMRFAPPAPITWRGHQITPRENVGLRRALEAQGTRP